MTDRPGPRIEEEIPDSTKEQLDESAEEIGKTVVQRLPDRMSEVVRKLLRGGGD